MKTKYTTGPWHIKPNHSARNIVHLAIFAENGYMICSITPQAQCIPVDEANAVLISCAPELLAMCRNALEALEGLFNDNAFMSEFERACIPALRKAIANANGDA